MPALAIVDELEASNVVTSKTAEEMRNCIVIKLTPCDDPRNVKQCKEKLEEVAKS